MTIRDAPTATRARYAGGGVRYVAGDVLTAPFRPASFGLVASVAALHHMPAVRALQSMAALLRPGGTLVVVGLARSELPATCGTGCGATPSSGASRARHR
jgi:SAM-dependent methyltransferase